MCIFFTHFRDERGQPVPCSECGEPAFHKFNEYGIALFRLDAVAPLYLCNTHDPSNVTNQPQAMP